MGPRRSTTFKKSSEREKTVLKKAIELSVLSGTDTCVIQFDPDGQLAKTWPQDRSEVDRIADAYRLLPEADRKRKTTNLCQFSHKKMLLDRNDSVKKGDHKFAHKLSEMGNSLSSHIPVYEEKARSLSADVMSRTESLALPSSSSSGFFSTDSLINDLQPPSLFDQQSMDHNPQRKFSVFLYNHDNSTFTQLPSIFDQPHGDSLQVLGTNNNNIHLLPPIMRTQYPLLHFDPLFASSWNQTASF